MGDKSLFLSLKFISAILLNEALSHHTALPHIPNCKWWPGLRWRGTRPTSHVFSHLRSVRPNPRQNSSGTVSISVISLPGFSSLHSTDNEFPQMALRGPGLITGRDLSPALHVGSWSICLLCVCVCMHVACNRGKSVAFLLTHLILNITGNDVGASCTNGRHFSFRILPPTPPSILCHIIWGRECGYALARWAPECGWQHRHYFCEELTQFQEVALHLIGIFRSIIKVPVLSIGLNTCSQ